MNALEDEAVEMAPADEPGSPLGEDRLVARRLHIRSESVEAATRRLLEAVT